MLISWINSCEYEQRFMKDLENLMRIDKRLIRDWYINLFNHPICLSGGVHYFQNRVR